MVITVSSPMPMAVQYSPAGSMIIETSRGSSSSMDSMGQLLMVVSTGSGTMTVVRMIIVMRTITGLDSTTMIMIVTQAGSSMMLTLNMAEAGSSSMMVGTGTDTGSSLTIISMIAAGMNEMRVSVVDIQVMIAAQSANKTATGMMLFTLTMLAVNRLLMIDTMG